MVNTDMAPSARRNTASETADKLAGCGPICPSGERPRRKDNGRLLLRLRLGLGVGLVFGAARRFRRGACGSLRNVALHAELRERLLVELAARRDVPGELELSQRGLRLGAEIAVGRAGVKPQLAQLLLHVRDEPGVGIARAALRRIGIRLLRMERGERRRRARTERNGQQRKGKATQAHAGKASKPRADGPAGLRLYERI